jgi:hypothetical protein
MFKNMNEENISGFQLNSSKINKSDENIAIQRYPTKPSILIKSLVIYNHVNIRKLNIE